MAFARDVDLLRYEPDLFARVRWGAQRLFEKAEGELEQGQLYAEGLSDGLGGLGMVALVDGVPYEMLDSSGQTVSVRRVAARADEEFRFPPQVQVGVVEVWTFRPQIELVHEGLMDLVGVDTSVSGTVVTNAASLVSLECVAALHAIFAGASGIGGEADGFARKAELYSERLRRLRERGRVELDLDGDGVAEVTRRFSQIHITRG